jgi:hypothetical protein
MKKLNQLQTQLAQDTIAAAEAGIGKHPKGNAFRLRQLCGEAFWSPLSNSDRRRAGTLIRAAVAQGLLPLRELDRDGANHRKYRIV